MPLLRFCLTLYLLSSFFISAQVIPSDRRINWTPGIPGGIPQISSPVQNVIDHGADKEGNTDSKGAIMSAINSLPASGGVVYMPAGKYKIASTIYIDRDGIVFRGDGPENTKLYVFSDGDCIKVAAFNEGPWHKINQGYKKGNDQIKIDNTADFYKDAFVQIQQENDKKIMYTKSDWEQPWAYNAVGQLFQIEEIFGENIKLKTPLHFDLNLNLNPVIRLKRLVKGVGFENFYIEKMIPKDHTFSFINSAYCWVKNVESYHTRRSHIIFAESLGNEVKESYFHHSFNYGGGGSGYGIECYRHSTNNLIENNIFDSLRHAMLIHVGANGNVYGYNYSVNTLQGEGETNLNQSWISPDISIHGHYPFMNLFEGNYAEEIGIADWWGPAGPGNTYFRNKINGDGIFYYDYSHRQNVIANNATVIKNYDSTSRDILEFGNIINSKTEWNEFLGERNLPASLYHQSKPAFLHTNNWPLFGPEAESDNKLPAEIRYKKLKNNKYEEEDKWIALFDGKTLNGWKANENAETWSVDNGVLKANGYRSHLFYIGPVNDHNFNNFEIKMDVMTKPGSNSGIYVHTKYQNNGWPAAGYECQIINSTPKTEPGRYVERKMTGSLYAVRNVWKAPVKDNEWFSYRIVVMGKTIRTYVNDELMIDYTEPEKLYRKNDKLGRYFSSGTFALQGHDPGSTVYFKNIKVKLLADYISSSGRSMNDSDFEKKIIDLSDGNFPMMDLHVHLKGGLSLEKALENARNFGFTYGIALNCGLKMEFENDAQVNEFFQSYKKPNQTYLAMQAEGREWTNIFSEETLRKFDYVFTDAMTWTNDRGKRMRLWIKEETEVGDPQNFMNQLVDRIESIVGEEPIDIYVNATYLPDEIKDRYDELWTNDRMDRVIDALAEKGVALEINDRYKIPSPKFIKRAKSKGVKFTFGTNNKGVEDLGRLEYCIDMIKECGLTTDDIWIPDKK